jgi:hypothetical protein
MLRVFMFLQVYGQPVFATAEDLLLRVAPKLDNLAGKEWLLRLGYRCA